MTERKYWFSAKRYGWGWSLPSSWEGRVVLAIFLGLMIVGSFIVPPSTSTGAFVAYVAILVALFFGVCWLKGEPPRWRWGKD